MRVLCTALYSILLVYALINVVYFRKSILIMKMPYDTLFHFINNKVCNKKETARYVAVAAATVILLFWFLFLFFFICIYCTSPTREYKSNQKPILNPSNLICVSYLIIYMFVRIQTMSYVDV